MNIMYPEISQNCSSDIDLKMYLKKMFMFKKSKSFVFINELKKGKQQFFGEIAAITQLRRTSSVIAKSSMLIGQIKIQKFLELYDQSFNFQRQVQSKFFNYKDQNICMLINMIKNAQLFGGNKTLHRSLIIEILSCLKEDSYHHMGTILELGEISDRLFFVTGG